MAHGLIVLLSSVVNSRWNGSMWEASSFWKTSEIVLSALPRRASFSDTNLVYVHSYGSNCRSGRPVVVFAVGVDEMFGGLLLRH